MIRAPLTSHPYMCRQSSSSLCSPPSPKFVHGKQIKTFRNEWLHLVSVNRHTVRGCPIIRRIMCCLRYLDVLCCWVLVIMTMYSSALPIAVFLGEQSSHSSQCFGKVEVGCDHSVVTRKCSLAKTKNPYTEFAC